MRVAVGHCVVRIIDFFFYPTMDNEKSLYGGFFIIEKKIFCGGLFYFMYGIVW
jgi:hypothetical protein